MRVLNVVQGTDEWFSARCGHVTGSKVASVMSKGSGRQTYLAQIVAEIITGKPGGSRFKSDAMAWGNDWEPVARAEYEIHAGVDVEQVGIVYHPTLVRACVSPDGLVGDNGLIEIKCPETHTHFDYILSGKIPSDYVKQMQWGMACAEREWCDFVTFDPRAPEHIMYWSKRVERDDSMIKDLEEATRLFVEEALEMAERLGRMHADR